VRRRSERRQRAAVVSVRLSVDEVEAVQEYAADRGLSLSGALRTATLEAAAIASAARYTGSSGSPVFNSYWQVVGMVTSGVGGLSFTATTGNEMDAFQDARMAS
jgi:hypothetical protein